MEPEERKFIFHCGAGPRMTTPLDELKKQRNDLAGVLNAVRVAVRLNNASLREDLIALLPRMDEILRAVERYPI
jgi:hypothetical protein